MELKVIAKIDSNVQQALRIHYMELKEPLQVGLQVVDPRIHYMELKVRDGLRLNLGWELWESITWS